MHFRLAQVFPFLDWLPTVTWESARADLFAGVTGAVIVLPQGVAFAIIAGLPPEYGLYTAMITPIVAALFGSSLHLVSGPTTAISIVVFSAVSRHAEPGSAEFISLALTITFLAGLYQLVFGILRMGVLVNFVSHTVIVGFTAGAAILIATSQVKNLLGVFVPKGDTFAHTWLEIWRQLDAINYYALAVGLVTLAVALAMKRWRKGLPNLLIGLTAGSVLAFLLAGPGRDIELIGRIPSQLPPLSMPDLSFASMQKLAPDAFAVALLGLIEAVSISRSIAARSHQRIDGNQEFIGQGLSNIAASFFSSYAGSGSFTRSGINYDAGARTPLSAIFSAIILMAIVLLIAPLTIYLPVAAMAGAIMMVAYNLIDFKQIRHILESSKVETSILLTTFFATLFLELEFAIYMGVLLSLVIFLGRTSTPDIVVLAPDNDPRFNKKVLSDIRTKPLRQCPHLKIIRVDMSVYFGSLDHIQQKLQKISKKHDIHHVLIVGSGINLIDLSGAEMLLHEAERLEEEGGGLYFTGLKPSVYPGLSRSHFFRDIGNNHFFDDKKHAIRMLHRLLRRQGHCENCQARVFSECKLDAEPPRK